MGEALYCVNHSDVETRLRCNKCGEPICSKCAVLTPVGYRCRDCVNAQQRVFYAGFGAVHYGIAAAVTLPLALVAGWLIPSLGWYAFVLGPLAGAGIAEAARWAVRRRRGEYTWLVVCGLLVVGALPRLLLLGLSFMGPVVDPAGAMYHLRGGLMRVLWEVVYLVAVVGVAYARLRPGRRI